MKKIAIESQYLYQYSTPESGLTVGGTQRYTQELGKLFHDLGWKVVVLTKACRDYTENTTYGTIVALKAPFGNKGNYEFSKKVYEYCNCNNVDLACYSDMTVGSYKCFENSFALQHGIAWDNPKNKYKSLYEGRMYLKTLYKYKKIICVDTNFINWVRERSARYFDESDLLVYVPNFADESQFSYKGGKWKSHEFPLLYPRRLRKMRGYDLFLDMCIQLKKQKYNIKPVLAFDDFKEEQLLKDYPNLDTINVEICHPKMSEIHELYYNSFLSYVPTIYSEGTSLSAIESVSCGCPVIGTYVGGIANVIVPGFNGLLVAPNIDALVDATKKCLDDIEYRDKMSANCEQMNSIFGLERWRRQVLESIKGLL